MLIFKRIWYKRKPTVFSFDRWSIKNAEASIRLDGDGEFEVQYRSTFSIFREVSTSFQSELNSNLQLSQLSSDPILDKKRISPEYRLYP
jgi:hypothetical protein